jgi:hypothetical protein
MTDDEPPSPSQALIESIKAGLRLNTSPFARECAETAQRIRESSSFQEMLKIDRAWRAAYEQARYELDYKVAKTPKAATTPQTIPNLSLEERIEAETEAVNAEAEKRNAAELELDAPAQATTEPPPAPALKAERCRILAAMVFRAAAARWAPTGQEERLAPEVIELIKRADRIEAKLDAVIKEADRNGQPWPNGKDLERTAGRQLRGNGLEVTNEEIHPFTKDEKYKAKRRPVGFH